MRLLTCADANYYTFVNALLKSNRAADDLEVTLVDWGLMDDQLDELRHIATFEHIPIRFPHEKRDPRMCTLQIAALRDTLKRHQDAVLSLDADFIFLESIAHDLEQVQDVAVTWLDFRKSIDDKTILQHYRGNNLWLNAGFFFCQYTKNSCDFVDHWLSKAEADPSWWGEQDALANLAKPYAPEGRSPLAQITYFPCTVYNCVPAAPFDKAKMIHMKGEKWHDIVTGKSEFPTKDRPEQLRPVYERWKEIRSS